MPKRALLAIIVSIVVLVCAFIMLCVVSWHFTFTRDGTAFLRIGETKDDVIASMIVRHIYEVRVLPDSNISVRASNEVYKLKGSVGIEYISSTWDTNGGGGLNSKNEVHWPGTITIGFTNNSVSYLSILLPPQIRQSYQEMFWEGEPESEVLDCIGTLITKHPGSGAINVIPGDPRLFLSNKYEPWEFVESANGELNLHRRDTSGDKTKLKQYNVWNFGIPRLSGIDVYWLYFDGDKLVKIVSKKVILPIIRL